MYLLCHVIETGYRTSLVSSVPYKRREVLLIEGHGIRRIDAHDINR